MNKIKIKNIKIPKDENDKFLYFLREDYDYEKIEEYKEMYKSGETKPVLIHRGTSILVDGFHRVKACVDLKEEYIDCEYTDCPKEQLREEAIKINISHGIPLSKNERNQQIKILRLEEKKTQEQIGKIFKISRNRVSEILQSSGVSETDTYKDSILIKFIEDNEVKQVKIAKELECSESTVSQVLSDFKNKIKELYLIKGTTANVLEELEEEITKERVEEIAEGIFKGKPNQIINNDFLKTDIKNVNLVITDPPYNISDMGGSHKKGNTIVTFNAGEWDKQDKNEFLKTFKQWLLKIDATLIKGGSFYIFVDKYLISYIWDLCKEIPGLKPKNILTWIKTNPVPNARNNFNSATEFILFGVKDGGKYTFNNLGYENMNNVFTAPICGGNERTEHPTQKPVSLIEKFVKISSNEEDIICDPFAGSGTTAIASMNNKRRFIIVEKNEKYFKIIKERLNES